MKGSGQQRLMNKEAVNVLAKCQDKFSLGVGWVAGLRLERTSSKASGIPRLVIRCRDLSEAGPPLLLFSVCCSVARPCCRQALGATRNEHTTKWELSIYQSFLPL